MILTSALAIEILFLALSLTVGLQDRGLTGARAAGISIVLSLATVLDAVGGGALLGGAGGRILALFLAFAAAAQLYLVVEEFLIEAHEEPETAVRAACSS